MHDIKQVRADPDVLITALNHRGAINARQIVDHLLALDDARKATANLLHAARTEKNELSAKIRLKGADQNDLKRRVHELKPLITDLQLQLTAREVQLHELASGIPNTLATDTPYGRDAGDNITVMHWNGHHQNTTLDHIEVMERLGGWAPSNATRLSGPRFTLLGGKLAKLHRALGQFMLNNAAQFGYDEFYTPTLVLPEAAYGTGQLPRFEDDLFFTSDQSHVLAPTGEVALTNLFADVTYTSSFFAQRVTTLSSCFRREAGSSGRDTHGLIRQHQFEKVELVTVCSESQAEFEQQRMLETAEAVLKKLQISFRRVLLCSADTGFSAKRTYDIEAWLPASKRWLEVSSVSWCGDFQARRINARYKATDGELYHLHTLNGSALAVGRTLTALLETHAGEHGLQVPSPLADSAVYLPNLLVWN